MKLFTFIVPVSISWKILSFRLSVALNVVGYILGILTNHRGAKMARVSYKGLLEEILSIGHTVQYRPSNSSRFDKWQNAKHITLGNSLRVSLTTLIIHDINWWNLKARYIYQSKFAILLVRWSPQENIDIGIHCHHSMKFFLKIPNDERLWNMGEEFIPSIHPLVQCFETNE